MEFRDDPSDHREMRCPLRTYVALLLLFFPAFSRADTTPAPSERPILISGFDDVLRQAHNQNLFRAALMLFQKDKTFSGMPELYSSLLSTSLLSTSLLSTSLTNAPEFFLVSGTTSLLQRRIKDFLQDSQYPPVRLFLRNWITEPSVENFKLASMRAILDPHPNASFMVVFDNSDPSLKLAEQIPLLFPNRTYVIYLRETVHRPAPENTKLFITAFDIARSENLRGTLTVNQAIEVGSKILAENDESLILPRFAYCPKDYEPCGGDGIPSGTHSPTTPFSMVDPALQSTCNELGLKIRRICESRH